MGETSKVTTALSSLIQDWLWAQRPPSNPTKLADLLGVGRSTVWNWMNAGRMPQPSQLILIHEKTNIPLRALYQAAGYPLPSEQRVYDDLITAVKEDTTLTEEERQRFISIVRERRSEYMAGRDTVSEAL